MDRLPKYEYLKNISQKSYDKLEKGKPVPKEVLSELGITVPEGIKYVSGDSFIKIDRQTKPLEVYYFDFNGRYYYYIIVTPVDESLAFAVDLYPVSNRRSSMV